MLQLLLPIHTFPLRAQPDILSHTGLFQIVPEQSVLTVMVGRSGLLSRFGHNHVIVNRSITGTVSLAGLPSQSYARLLIPVSELQVDEPDERRRAGAGFESVPDDRARTDTRANMLGPVVLDGEHWPQIRVDATLAGGEGDTHMVDVQLTFRGTSIPLQLPARLTIEDERLQVEARFSLEHDQLGLQPFSTLGGALRVAETLQFELTISAIRVPS